MPSRPCVAIVGGPDVDARLPLLRELRNEFSFCAFGSDPRLAARFAQAGFAFRHYPLSRRVAPFADLRTLHRLRTEFVHLRPDIVHAFDTKPGVFAALAARRARVPVVVATVTGLGSLYGSNDLRTRLLRGIYERLQRMASRRADATIFQNHDDARQLAAAGVVPAARASVILGSGVDTDRFTPDRFDAAARAALRAELGIPASAVVVTMVARVTRSKGIPEFVAAARALRTTAPQAHFLLVGADDRDSRDRLTADELDELRAAVTWPGRRDDVDRVLAASDLCVLPTAYREGVPRVLLEAAAMGLPLVATDSPGCNEIVHAGTNGLLIPAGDAAALSRAVAELVADPALRRRLGDASRRRAIAVFDLRVVAGQLRQLYRRLLARSADLTPPALAPLPSGTAGRGS